MGIGNFGLTELFIIVVLVLVFFGPREMPEIARTLARFLRDVRRNVNEIMREFEDMERAGGDGGGRSSGRSGARPGDRVLPPGQRGAGRPDRGGPYRAGEEPPGEEPEDPAGDGDPEPGGEAESDPGSEPGVGEADGDRS